MIIVLRRLHGNFGHGMFHLAILRHLGCTFARPRSAQSSNAVTYIDVLFTYPTCRLGQPIKTYPMYFKIVGPWFG